MLIFLPYIYVIKYVSFSSAYVWSKETSPNAWAEKMIYISELAKLFGGQTQKCYQVTIGNVVRFQHTYLHTHTHTHLHVHWLIKSTICAIHSENSIPTFSF